MEKWDFRGQQALLIYDWKPSFDEERRGCHYSIQDKIRLI
jgi:hypothetical protein